MDKTVECSKCLRQVPQGEATTTGDLRDWCTECYYRAYPAPTVKELRRWGWQRLFGLRQH